MSRIFLSLLFCFILAFSIVSCTPSLQTSICNQKPSNNIKVSDYDSVRSMLSAIDSIDRFEFAPTSIAAKIAKIAIYAEDWIHTNKAIERITNEILSTAKLANVADYPKLSAKFEKYVKTSRENWIPDRDYPQIGYFPKKLLFDQCLGEKEIIKYWSEASPQKIKKYVALSIDEVIFNYKLVWHDLLAKN